MALGLDATILSKAPAGPVGRGVIGVRSCNHANASLQDLTRGPTRVDEAAVVVALAG